MNIALRIQAGRCGLEGRADHEEPHIMIPRTAICGTRRKGVCERIAAEQRWIGNMRVDVEEKDVRGQKG